MIFHQLHTERGCQSYLVGCPESGKAAIIDPELSLIDRYQGLLAHDGLQLAYLIDTHTHADHFSAGKAMSEKLDVPVVMHRNSPAPYVDLKVDDGELIVVGSLRLKVLYTPGHTTDSVCLHLDDRVFTGDTLLIGGTGRTDLPTGDPEQLYDSLFGKLLKLDPATLVFPAHIYNDRSHSTIGDEIANNKRLQLRDREAFVKQMRELDLGMPDHLTESLRANLHGGKTVSQLIGEAARKVPFMALDEVRRRQEEEHDQLTLLDVREQGAFAEAHIPGAINIPRGQLELRVNDELPDPTRRIIVYCELGKISTLAAATLKEMGYSRAVALDRGMQAWKQAGYPVESGPG